MKKRTLSRSAAGILHWGLPAVSAVLLGTVFYISGFSVYDAARYYPATASAMEHILMSLLLVVCGALLADIAEKRQS